MGHSFPYTITAYLPFVKRLFLSSHRLIFSSNNFSFSEVQKWKRVSNACLYSNLPGWLFAKGKSLLLALPRLDPPAVPQTLARLAFPAQVLKGGTQILLVYPTINCLERRHLHPARRFGDLLGRPRLLQLFVYVIQYLLFPKHPAVAVAVAQVALLLRRVRIIPRNISVKGAISPQFPGYGTYIPA